ncbi:hypothetical protein [Glutamicibacter sp. NPDC087344]|uniref:hypothetical protein n=1 Tax=Glutamicibacter sp. NPDC087344 TaxID=3363994 RepID=UPI0038004396
MTPAQLRAHIAAYPYCDYAIFEFLTQKDLKENIATIIDSSLKAIYQDGQWEKDFHQANEVLSQSLMDEEHYSTLYDYISTYPAAAAWTVVQELEKIGCRWVYSPDGDHLFEAFGLFDDEGKETNDFFGETMEASEGYGQCSYTLRTPEYLAANWVKALKRLIDELWELAVDPR